MMYSMSSETAALPTLEEMKQRLASIEREADQLRESIELRESAAELQLAMDRIDRSGGLPGLEALAKLRVELGLPPRDDAPSPEAGR
jgi:hypothetical protein